MMWGRYRVRNVLSMQGVMKNILLILPMLFASELDAATFHGKCHLSFRDISNFHNCFGKVRYDNGTGYDGGFKDGKYHGQGTYKQNGVFEYIGEWKDGKRNGQGTGTFANGNKYVGEWKDDNYHGQGTFTYADGRQSVGRWKNNQYQDEYQIVKSAADCYEVRYRKVTQYQRIYNSLKEQYRGLPSHFIENARDDYLEDVRRADAEYEECKRKSVN